VGHLDRPKIKTLEATSMVNQLYHYTSYHHLLEIVASGKLKLTNSNLLEPVNLRIENGNAVSDTDWYKPVVWLTSREAPTEIGVYFADMPMPPEHDKRRIRITIPNTVLLGIRPWNQWATQNHMNRDWRRALTKGMDSSSWYITEQEIPLAAASQIVDLWDKIEYVGWK